MSHALQARGQSAARFTMTATLAAVGAALMLIARIGGAADGTGAGAPRAEVEASAAWIRWLPGDLPAGGYLTLHNRGTHAATLVGASSTGYAEISIHRSINQGGTSSMQPVQQLRLEPGESVNFGAGGYHLMLEHPTTAVHPGDHVPITLHFEGGSSMTVSFEVRPPAS